jgi:two-component system, sensor histidine kinase
MTPQVPKPAPPESLTSPIVSADVVFSEQIKVLYISHPYGAIGGIAATLFIAAIWWGKVPHLSLLIWAGLVIGIEIFGLYHHFEYKTFKRLRANKPIEITETRKWSRDYAAAGAVAGIFWGLAAFMLYVPGAPEYQILLFLALCLVISFSVIALSIHLPALYGFTLGVALPMVLKLVSLDTRTGYIVVISLGLYCLLCLGMARRLNQTLMRSLRLRLENQALVERLQDLVHQLTIRSDEAERANLAKTRFLAAASHDLRQPMHAIGLFVGTLRAKIQYPAVRDIVDKIQASVVAMEALFADLLDISRLDAGTIVANVKSFSIDELMQRIDHEFHPDAIDKGIHFRVVRSSARVKSDPVLLNRIITNLVANAIRYTREGRVLLGCRRTNAGLRLEVRDTGIGIAAEHCDDIFQEFFQLQNPERDRSKGLGLGLSIVQRHAALLNHRVEVQSVLGKGSCFSVSLPYGDAAREIEPLTNDDKALRAVLAGTFTVVVDDEPDVRAGMEALLAEWSCLALSASSGDDAVKQLQRHERTPDLIVSDYQLQGNETGLDAIRRIRESLQQAIPAILITGDARPERLRDAQAHGLKLLIKPVEPSALQAAMVEALGELQQQVTPLV